MFKSYAHWFSHGHCIQKYSVFVCVRVNWPLLYNKSSICWSLLRLSSETNFMNENIPPINIRTYGWHPSSFRLPIFVGNRAVSQLLCYCICVRSYPANDTHHRIDNNCLYNHHHIHTVQFMHFYPVVSMSSTKYSANNQNGFSLFRTSIVKALK